MHAVSDFFAFIGRLGIGIILVAHGWQKLADYGIEAVGRGFASTGIPLPQLAAWFTALVELVGGAFLVLGLLLPLAGLLIAFIMAGAVFFVHLPHGLFSPEGFELPMAIGVAALALGFNGGRWSLDHALFGRLRTRRTERVPSES
ncbi:DoxX family protein [Saccharopolyspora hordei]|uniref:Putative oxidoreductase n=1 Tax=Saccharopolyspora hordei TaxID=1838 RepID=A0A853AIX6_9PSEU|nr:DoxX family protein [Saccharopolyspora hordei]NYI84604.1 putative oxidoreductase [Saccharopolyspora hordei]